MTIVFVSNFLNHHQIALCQSLVDRCSNFKFIAMDNNGSQGFQKSCKAEYVIDFEKEKEKSIELICKSDIAVFGSCPDNLIELRIRENRVSFIYSERFFKKGVWRRWIPRTREAVINRVCKYKRDNLYVLCASAFLSYELSLLGFPEYKCYKWGYFPALLNYDAKRLFSKKKEHNILWVGRFLDWKHPDDVLKVAKKLKDNGYSFSIEIGGTGELENKLRIMIENMGISDYVSLLGSLSPEAVRSHMEEAGIYLFTSDRQEGWGAVLNEAMNSGCAVVASHAIGSVPYLLKHNENGLVYHSGNSEELYERIICLLDNPQEQERLGKAAYETIVCEWNAEVAAERLVNLSEHLLLGEKYPNLYQTGPCSRAGILVDNWFNG